MWVPGRLRLEGESETVTFGNRNKSRFSFDGGTSAQRSTRGPRQNALRLPGKRLSFESICKSGARIAVTLTGLAMCGIVSLGVLVATQPKLNWYWIQGAADLAYDWRKYDAAAFWGEFALKNAERLRHDPEILAVTLNKLARTYVVQGRRKEAATLQRRVASIRGAARADGKPRSRVF